MEEIMLSSNIVNKDKLVWAIYGFTYHKLNGNLY